MALSRHEETVIEKLELVEYAIPEEKKRIKQDTKVAAGATLMLSGVTIGMGAIGLEAIEDGRYLTALYPFMSSITSGFFSVAAGASVVQKVREFREIEIQEQQLLMEDV